MRLTITLFLIIIFCSLLRAQVDAFDKDTLYEEEVIELEYIQTPTLIGDPNILVDSLEEMAFTLVDTMPQFPGGLDSLSKYLISNIIYPEYAKINRIEGFVYIVFIIGVDGRVSTARIMRGIGGGCDEEALRVIKAMPRWTPGCKNGNLVPVKYNIPIRFTMPVNYTSELPTLKPGEHYDYDEIIEVAPQFPGGEDSLNAFLLSHVVYPIEAQENNVQGTVYVNFAINEDGSVSDIHVMRGIGAGCDEEAIRVITLMPKWSPALKKGKPTKVKFNIPVRFIMN